MLGAAQLRGALPLRAEAAGAAAGRREAAQLAVLHRVLADPVDPGIVADGLVEGVHGDHLVPAVHSILRDPVGVQHPEAAALAPDPLLRDAAEVPRRLDLVDAAVLGLPVDDALGHALLAAATLHADAVDDVALLRLVAELARLVGPGGPGRAVDGGQLAVLPRAHAREEAHDVGLLLAPELLEILVSAHLALLALLSTSREPPKSLKP